MAEAEKVHYLTEAIYKNILDNFNPGVRQLITTGRALQKALHQVTTQAKAYIDCIYGLAQSAQVCKGATSEIGAALLQIAEVHKEINTQVIDNIKSCHAELLIPLETKQDGDFKTVQLFHKKYVAGHKYHNNLCEKAKASLKKQKKKSKGKFGFDQKEMQYAREVKECQGKLEDYHLQNLRVALLEERKRYCFMLDRVCTMVRNNASHHSKAHELYTHRLPEWSDLCKIPHILPDTSEAIVNAFRNHQHEDLYSNTDDVNDLNRRPSLEFDRQNSSQDSNSLTYGTPNRQDSSSLTYGTAHRQPHESPYSSTPNGMLKTQDDYAVEGMHRPGGPMQSAGRRQARAMYSHVGSGETQLSFAEGDLLSLVGERREGWQYGENTRTHRLGWFPISFTEPVGHSQQDNFSLTQQRVKSLGNLTDLRAFNEDYRMAPVQSSGHSDSDSVSVRQRNHQPYQMPRDRPMSMHVGSHTMQMANTKESESVLPPPEEFQDDSNKSTASPSQM